MVDLLIALDSAVRRMTEGRDVAVAYSGGLDSGAVAVLAKRYARSVRLYTVGTDDSQDVTAAKEMCQIIGCEWVHIPMDENSLREGLRRSIGITGTLDPVTLSFEVPLMYILPNVREEYVIGGQGADETFWGYSKYLGLSEDEVRRAVARDLITLRDVTLVHESRMAETYGKTALYPFLDSEVQEAVSELDYEQMVPRGDDRKRPLKDAVVRMGYPQLADRTKKAAQYGTGSMNMIRRMAKKDGLSVSEFISSLAGSAPDWMDSHSQRRIVPGLDRITELARRLGDPQNDYRVIHVAGSDGKGSVCSMLYSMLQASGIRTGMFSSPYIEDRTECISVCGHAIPEEQMSSVLEDVRKADAGLGSTYFEILTAAAFLWFSRCGVEYAVVETGMGGREDATNIVVPDVSVITNVSTEHTAFLGGSIGEIASHKAGIIKPGRPAVTSAKGDALEVIRRRAEECGSNLTVVSAAEITGSDPDGSSILYRGERYRVGIPGTYQAENAPLAIEAVMHSSADVTIEGIRRGLETVRLRARMERIPGTPFVIDGTHTDAGMEFLCRDMPSTYGEFVTVFGVLDDKDAEGMARMLSKVSARTIVTQPCSDRALPAERLMDIFRGIGAEAELVPDLRDAMEHAERVSGGRTILITGSFRMAEGAIRWLRTGSAGY